MEPDVTPHLGHPEQPGVDPDESLQLDPESEVEGNVAEFDDGPAQGEAIGFQSGEAGAEEDEPEDWGQEHEDDE